MFSDYAFCIQLINNCFDKKSFFSIKIFFHGHWRLIGQQRKGGDLLLFHSTTFTHSRTFRHLFSTLHVRWLSHIFNRIACIYQTATRWDLPLYRITIWLIDDVTLCFCLFMWWFDSSFFCYSNLRRETSGFELASTITLVLHANRLIKCAKKSIVKIVPFETIVLTTLI